MHSLAARVLLPFVLSLAGFVRAAPAQTPPRIEDPDYCFRIESPGPDWTLLADAQARAVSPDAIAGLTHKGESTFMVVVEAAPSVTIDGFAAIIRDQLAIEEAEFSNPESLTYHEMAARRWTATGIAGGVRVRFRTLVFLRDGFAYQLVGFCTDAPKGGKSSVDLSVLEKHFFLTPGTVRARKAEALANARGPGWRVVDGVYQNAANGLEIRAPDGWRFAVGDELMSMNNDACVGLICTDPEAFIVWIITPTGGVSEAEYAANEQLEFGPEAKSGEPLQLSSAGLELSVTPKHLPRASPIVFLQGTRVRDGLAVQVRAWCMEGLEDRAIPQMEQALKAARFLAPAERKALAAELGGKRDPQNVVGDDECLRGGTYRNFAQRFTWTKPAGFWRVDMGALAREQNEEATILMHAGEWGVSAIVIVETDVEVEAREYHDVFVSNVDAVEPPEAPNELKLGSTPAWMSVVRSKLDALERTHFLVSAVREKRAYQISAWCLSGNVAAARPAIDAAIQGLRITGKAPETERNDEGFVDHRVGFRLKKPAGKGWKFRDVTRPEMATVGSMVAYSSSMAEILGAGICSIGEQQDRTVVRRMVIDAIRKNLGLESDERSAVGTAAVLGGIAAERFELRTGKQTVFLYIMQRDSTVYYVTVATDGEKGSPTEGELVGLFELID
jgi:hypothetical protein